MFKRAREADEVVDLLISSGVGGLSGDGRQSGDVEGCVFSKVSFT